MKKTIAIALVLMLCISALSISAFAAGTVTVTAEVPADWTTAYCYYWVDGGAAASWPGIQMTKSGNKWTAEIPNDSNRVIITAGASGPQTLDLTVEAGKNVNIVLGAMQGTKYTASVNGVAPAPAPTPSGYYVTGSTEVFGNWAECNEAGKMTESNGVYVKEFTGVAAGDYSVKVNDGTWSNSWGGNGENGNYDFNVAEANSTVKVTYNPADNTVTVEVNGAGVGGGEPIAPPVNYDAYYVTGSTEWLGNWAECNEAGKMTEADGVYTKTFENVTAGTVALKVNVGSWAADWGYNGNNFKFDVAEGDSVTVTFNPATQTVSVAVNGVNVNPVTGDMSLAGVGIALLAASAGLVALVGKKKEF